jgi:uncharacterized SAM-binding protein YcdF (DUF218 family)
VSTSGSEITKQSQPRVSSDPGRARRQNWLIVFLVLAILGAIGVLLTLVWFVFPATQDVATVENADAVVLFAGTLDRLDTALELMGRGAAPNLVIPNGTSIEGAQHLCESAPFRVFCPESRTVDTVGEAETIALLASEHDWSDLIAVTSVYHVHRATSLLGRCFDGGVQAVTPDRAIDREDLVEKVPHEWVGFLASFVLGPSC